MTSVIVRVLACALIGYIIGGINPAFLLAKAKGFDIRTKGTGNAGASNATIVMGKGAGVFCAVFDILKAVAAVKICTFLFPDFHYAVILAGTCCVLGHIFPAAMNFRGGKGLAALGGVALAYNLKVFLVLLLIEIVIILIVDYICLIPTTGSVLLAAVMAWQKGILFALIFVPVIAIVFLKHRENFRNIRYGIEYRIRFFWKREAELQRVQANRDKLTEEQKKQFLREE